MHNDRFPQQWEIITRAVDVKGKDVLDLGSGYGDMVKAMHAAGANVVGIEGDPIVFELATRDGHGGVMVNTTIESFTAAFDDHNWDIIVCFSVLPYILDEESLLFWIASHVNDCALLEIQLKGDGPGEYVDDDDIKETLERHFINVVPIGKTLVPYRNMYRTIWKCSQSGE